MKARGTAAILDGKLRFGSWTVAGDHSVVDEVKALTGGDATIFQLIDGKPMRVTTTILKLHSSERNDNTELVGLAICCSMLFAILRPLRRNAKMLADAARGLARGEVEQEVTVRTRDELGEIAAAFRDMIAYQQRMTVVATRLRTVT